MKKNRFYWAKSPIYGNTVYDRTTQTPAYDLGATHYMPEVRCAMLVHRFNHLDSMGKLDAYRDALMEEMTRP